MIKTITKSFLILGVLAVVFATACTLDVPDFAVRVVLEHVSGSSAAVKVFVEGADGRSLDAAKVLVIVPSGVSMLLNYAQASACYAGQLPSPEQGSYIVSVQSITSKNPLELTIPFVPLSVTPEISEIADDLGVSYSQGGNPSAARAINISWSAASGATSYLLRVMKNVTTVWSTVTSGTSCLIPAGAITSGTCSWSVEAQSISGDPLLGTAPYYTVSSIKGATVVCTLAP